MKRKVLFAAVAVSVISIAMFTGCSEMKVISTETTDVQPETTDTHPETADESASGYVVYDRDQKEVALSDLISPNKVTMLNFWGTFCGPCLREMPDLGDLEREYRDRGFEIVGVTIDAVDFENGSLSQSIIEDAERITKDTNVEYPIVFAGVDMINDLQISAVPTTYFVDEKGNVLEGPIIGSKSRSEWESIITKLMK